MLATFKPYLLALCCAFAVVTAGCSKKKKDNPNPGGGGTGAEANIAVTVPNIELEKDDNLAQGTTLALKLNVTSTPLPKDGYTITVTATDPAGQAITQNAAVTATGSSADFTLINLPSGKVADIVVTVTSVAKPSNTVTLRFGVFNKAY